MLLCADENIDGTLISQLREAGHTVLSIAEQRPGIEDEEVLNVAYHQKAIVLTEDKRFGEMVYRDGLPTFGVLLLRFPDDLPFEVTEFTIDAVNRFGENLIGMFSVVSRKAFRMHPLPR